MARQLDLPIVINRDVPLPTLLPFTEYFRGFERVGAVRRVFGEDTAAVLEKQRIGFISNRRMYMGIRDEDGSIAVGTYHLKHSDERTLYLDIVHELFHVNQRMEDSEYFHREHMKFMRDRSLYYASPIEVQAYIHTVREAERIGMSYDEIVDYLRMGPAPPRIFDRFLKEMEIKPKAKSPRSLPARLPVSIGRNPSLTYYQFLDYFKGFEHIPAVRVLFGKRTERILGRLRVEFVASPFAAILPNEEDGHPVADPSYVKKGDKRSIYLDVLLCLNFLRHADKGKTSHSPVERGQYYEHAILESYKAMAEEARRIRVPEPEILKHLRLPQFMMTPARYRKFLQSLGLSDQRR